MHCVECVECKMAAAGKAAVTSAPTLAGVDKAAGANVFEQELRIQPHAQRSRPSTAQRTSSRILATTSGRSAMQWKVQVSTAAVVSCPAISSVMRSSRSCLEVMSSPVAG